MFELTEFLVDMLGVTDTGAELPAQGHDAHRLPRPPRAGRGRAADAAAAERPRPEYCELPNIEECCGFGGTFSVKMPGTSLAMGRTKVENIVRSGADVVVSNDISCLMHIGGMLRRNPATRHIRTMHIAEVLVADRTGGRTRLGLPGVARCTAGKARSGTRTKCGCARLPTQGTCR